MTADIRVGDSVRVLDTTYTATAGEHIRLMRGQVGTVVAVHDLSDAADILGFDALYDVEVKPWVPVPLITADIELVARPARIT